MSRKKVGMAVRNMSGMIMGIKWEITRRVPKKVMIVAVRLRICSK